jgi:hypothetical protein
VATLSPNRALCSPSCDHTDRTIAGLGASRGQLGPIPAARTTRACPAIEAVGGSARLTPRATGRLIDADR